MHASALHSSCYLWLALEGIYHSSHSPLSCLQPVVRSQDPTALAPRTQHPKGSAHCDPAGTEAECMAVLSPGLQLPQSSPGTEADEVEKCPEEDGRGMGETTYRFGPGVGVCSGI